MRKGEGNRKRKCKNCNAEKRANEGFIAGVNFVCDFECANKLAIKARNKQREKTSIKAKQAQAESEKAANKQHRERRKEVKPLKYWQDRYQDLVNQYVVHVRDKDKPCCTCGTTAPDIKYDAGHYRTRKACPELRYDLFNIHKQCSVNCNQYGSGMRAEYRDFITAVYGSEKLDWLNGKHEPLKVKFPHWSDYEAEIIRYRKILRDAGLKPCN
jgi:hypothetical protein